MNKNKRRRSLAMFGSSAIFAFAVSLTLSWADVAHSTTITTVPWVGCHGVGAGPSVEASCSLPQGDDMPIGSLSGVYFEFAMISGRTYSLEVMKTSYTGSVYRDNGMFKVTQNGATSRYVAASNVVANPSVYDYLEASILQDMGGSLTLYGVAEVNPL